MKHSINLSGIAVLMLLLAACAVGPDYHAPRPLSGSLINAHAAQGMSVEERPLEGLWWQQFDDLELDALMRRALSDNLDLQVASARVREARAAFRGSEYDFAPHVPATAGYQHSREQVPGFGTQRYDAVGYDAGFDTSWEIDLFGHVRRSVEAARDDLDAERAALRAAQITVAAEVARNYFALRSTQQQIEVARHNLDNQRESARITTVRYESGRGSELDVARSRARMQATEAALPALESAESAGRYRLAVLLGARPGALDEELKPHPMPAYAKALPIGDTGADAGALLSRRPDVLEAERRLAGATARVGVATADLFPRVTVTGFVGFLSGDFSHLFSTSAGTDARAWSVSPTISWAAFDYGSLHAKLRARRAEADESLVQYEKTVLGALEETENALVNYREQQKRLASLIEQAASSRRAADLAGVQYREGVADFLSLLDAQRTQLEAESAVAQTEGEVNVSVVAIYKALGGVGQPPLAPQVARSHPGG
jgi:multidrug efflux system outer membrane protein